MISKIIQVEKERQEEYFSCGQQFKDTYQTTNVKKCDGSKFYLCDSCKIKRKAHKQSLINLKEYMEAEYKKIMREVNSYKKCYCADCSTKIHKFLKSKNEEDIKALSEMIKKYD